ncbi:unnamed protein product [Polarella glacialis]|uniref:Serine aminopeptidase S33 domain-containing protein n=1 Tax=Polarella glacialis TaxID=89957 RepID=A0A813KVA9_POLGL|nr:unnamed protein product [Polarella glacialis]
MPLGLQWIVDKITFPSPPASYSLTSHPELFFIPGPKSRPAHPGVPCMLYAIRQGAPVLLVHAHSNGCDIGDMRQTLQSISESLRVHVMSFEFPGYGLHLGAASMRTIDETAAAVLEYITNELKVNLAQVVWYGRSIGSGPALRAVHRVTKDHKVQPGGVVLQCGFANFPEVAGHLFGRVAKRLVSTLWPNEAMLKELHCPVLLIHGRNDTMIPISQSEKLWAAVSLKDLSHFHTCDCGHNDFNFRRCTLRPIYDFLLGVISSPTFPGTNFFVEVPSPHRAFVHHIGPLRSKIPVYSFRRPDLEDWLRRMGGQADITAKGVATASGSDKTDVDFNSKVATETTVEEAVDEKKLQVQGRQVAAPGPRPASKGRSRKKGSLLDEPPPIPDYSCMPAIEDVSIALLDPEGMVRTCATRVAAFLERLQRKLDRIDSLECKSLEEVVDLVETEFWASDPLLCLWEEVSLPGGEHVRFRLGPFSVDSRGQRSFDQGLGSGSSSGGGRAGPQLLRVPLWIHNPSQAHFRCLAEWSLLHSERLQKNLPSAASSSQSSGCCCAPLGAKKKGTSQQGSNQPSRGSLATSLAAHFCNWVEKTDEIRGLFERFVRLYKDPEEALRRHAQSSQMARALGAAGLKEMMGDQMPLTANAELDEEALPSPRGRASPPARPPASVAGCTEQSLPSPPPWPAAYFSATAKSLLLDGGSRSFTFAHLAERLRSSASAPTAANDRQEGNPLPNPDGFQSTAEYVANPGLQLPVADRFADLTTAGLLLHYERLLAGANSTGEIAPGMEDTGDPTRSELRCTGLALNKVIKAFANADLRERRELQRQSLSSQMPRTVPSASDASKVPQPSQPSEPGGDVEPPEPVTPAPDRTGPAPVLQAGTVEGL